MCEPAQMCAPARDVRDRLGEALRRASRGLMRPLWADMSEAEKDIWRDAADRVERVCLDVGLKLEISA